MIRGDYCCLAAAVDPGAVDVIDLARRRLVGSIAIPRQPAGITILHVVDNLRGRR